MGKGKVMLTSDGQLEVQEIESGTYVFPNSKKYASTWALFVYSDGRAEFYKKRDLEKGSLLGKPLDLGKPVIKIHPSDLAELLNQPNSIIDVYKLAGPKPDQEIFEFRGEKYFQTVSVPPQTKTIM